MKPTEKKEKVERAVFSFRLNQALVERAKKINPNLAKTIEALLRQYVKESRKRSEEYLSKQEAALKRLARAQREWFVIELRRAREAGDVAAIKHYEGLLNEK